MITFQNATLIKGETAIFERLNFHLREGEHWVVHGHNGAGKTVLLEALAGRLRPRAGQIHFSFITGDDWDERYRQRQERIHLMPTEWLQTVLFAGEHFYQERYYAQTTSQTPRVRDFFRDKIDTLSDMNFPPAFNIDRLLNLEITRLSNGQLRKVVILQQLVRNIPRLLLLDYPYDGLDAISRRELNDFLDHMVTEFNIHLVIVAHEGVDLPRAINGKLIVHNGTVTTAEHITRVSRTTTPALPAPRPQSPEGTGDVIMEMRNLTIAYGGYPIISNLNWLVRRGERWALTGRNGSGKTTLFSLIYADHPMAYSQEVYLFGRRRGSGESIWDIKNRINYFGPEQIHFIPMHRVTTTRRFILSHRHTNSDRLNDLVNFFNAAHYIDKSLMELSSGQLQMTMLINAFLDRRELLLMDEPFQYLDASNHARVAEYLNLHLSEETTLILITHDERDVRQWTHLRKELGSS